MSSWATIAGPNRNCSSWLCAGLWPLWKTMQIGGTESCCLKDLTLSLYSVCTTGTLNCAQINMFFSVLFKLTAFLGSSQSLLRSLLLTLKKMFKKTLKADIYFDPEASDFEEGEAVFYMQSLFLENQMRQNFDKLSRLQNFRMRREGEVTSWEASNWNHRSVNSPLDKQLWIIL